MDNQYTSDKGAYKTLRSGIRLYPSQDKAINQVLTDLRQQLPAHFILLADVTGQIISALGKEGQADLVALGSLVAGDLAASQEIARLTGQYQDYQMVLREGQNIHTFTVEASHYLALLVQISQMVPLGWGRMLIRQAAHQLVTIVAQPPEENEQARVTALEDQLLGQEALSDLFNDALDGLWQE